VTGEPGDDGARAFIEVEGLGVLSRAAFRLHGYAIVNSLKDGHPGFVSDGYLNAISAETTVTVLELEAAGIWERRNGGYFVVADDMLRDLIDHNDLQSKLVAACVSRGAHVPGESDGSGSKFCADCGMPIAGPDGEPRSPDRQLEE
jgi:hypothetical protein